MTTKKTLRGPGGILLVLDGSDPDTPAMVYEGVRRKYSSTYNCACGEGYIDDIVELNIAQLEWLEKQQNAVDEVYTEARKGNPEYS